MKRSMIANTNYSVDCGHAVGVTLDEAVFSTVCILFCRSRKTHLHGNRKDRCSNESSSFDTPVQLQSQFVTRNLLHLENLTKASFAEVSREKRSDTKQAPRTRDFMAIDGSPSNLRSAFLFLFASCQCSRVYLLAVASRHFRNPRKAKTGNTGKTLQNRRYADETTAVQVREVTLRRYEDVWGGLQYGHWQSHEEVKKRS